MTWAEAFANMCNCLLWAYMIYKLIEFLEGFNGYDIAETDKKCFQPKGAETRGQWAERTGGCYACFGEDGDHAEGCGFSVSRSPNQGG